MEDSTNFDGNQSQDVRYHDEALLWFSGWEETENMDDLDKAIEAGERALRCATVEGAELSAWHNDFSAMLKTRYDALHCKDDLLRSNEHAREAIVNLPGKDPRRALLQHNLALGLWTWFSLQDDVTALEESIALAENNVSCTPIDSIYFPDFLHSVSVKRNSRYLSFSSAEDLDAAIAHLELALEIAPKDHSERADWYNDLGVQLQSRFVLRGDVADVDKAIELSRQAVELAPNDDVYLSNLGSNLESLYQWEGNIRELEEAIKASTQSIEAASEEDPRLGIYLVSLGSKLMLRSEATGDAADAEQAVSQIRAGLEIIGTERPDRFVYNATLSSALRVWYQRKQNIEHLRESAQILQTQLDTAPATHPDRTAWMNNLAQNTILLNARKDFSVKLSKVRVDLQRTIKQLPAQHSDKGPLCSALGAVLRHEYESGQGLEPLMKAIEWDRTAVSSVDTGSYPWAVYQRNLGMHLLLLYEAERRDDVLSDALESLLSSAEVLHISPLDKIEAIRGAIKCLVLQEQLEKAQELASDALGLLPAVCGRYRTVDDQQYVVSQTAGLAADCCSLALRVGHVETAIKELELGRGLIWGYMIDDRESLQSLQNDIPDLALRYEALRSKVGREPAASSSPVVRERLLDERGRDIVELEECIQLIRSNPKHEGFLLPPSAEEMKKLSREGPIVVVNITDISADLIIITEKELRHRRLVDLKITKAPPSIQARISDFARQRGGRRDAALELTDEDNESRDSDPSGLIWLWDHCVSPALEELDGMGLLSSTDGRSLQRVWWVGPGAASSLPFHAACASHDDFVRCTAARVISSYTPTIKALMYARARASHIQSSMPPDPLSVLAVAMPTTPGQQALPGAEKEAEVVTKACRNVCHCEVHLSPTVEQVLSRLSNVSILHFACHASLDPRDALESHLLLQKQQEDDKDELVVDRLTLGAVARLIGGAKSWIAFLSACSTAGTAARKFEDESLHLVAGFQLAGFPHVVGALWPANDDACVDVAGSFYQELFAATDGRVSSAAIALSLHRALLSLRRRFPRDPYIWAPFVHFGP